MKWYANLKISVKLISAFTMVSIILAFVGFYGLNNLAKLHTSLDEMYNKRLVPMNQLNDVQILYQRLRINIRDIADTQTKSDKDNYANIVKDIRAEIEQKISAYSNVSSSKEADDKFKNFTPAWQAYNKLFDQAVQFSYDGKDAEYHALLRGDLKKSGDALNAVLDDLIKYNVSNAEKAKADAASLYDSSRSVTITIIVVSLLLSIGFGYFIAQLIARPLHRIVRLVSKVAAGDLRETTDISTKDEVGQLAGSMNEMVLKLRLTVNGIVATSQSVAAAAQQISASTEEIAGGSTSQASAAQTMNELFKELTQAIHSVAQSAEQAADISNKTTDMAQEGGKVVRSSIEGMNQVNVQMSQLEQDSIKVGEIIEVIDDIADQTNLLALNAAIEAARAGDQGRGFAVVADEVRKLAERSSEATKQINAIIKGMQENTQQSVKAVADGVDFSQKTGEAFDHIISMVNGTATKVTEIAAASEEQAAQSSEVLIGIESISASTQESAAACEETAATAMSLAQLAEELNDSISMFKTQ